MTSRTHRRFWHEFNRLPAHVQCFAREKFQLWLRDPFHPSMQFKPLVGNVWSVRIGDHYRAVAQKHGDLVVWFWIGTHEDYNIDIFKLNLGSAECAVSLSLSR